MKATIEVNLSDALPKDDLHSLLAAAERRGVSVDQMITEGLKLVCASLRAGIDPWKAALPEVSAS